MIGIMITIIDFLLIGASVRFQGFLKKRGQDLMKQWKRRVSSLSLSLSFPASLSQYATSLPLTIYTPSTFF